MSIPSTSTRAVSTEENETGKQTSVPPYASSIGQISDEKPEGLIPPSTDILDSSRNSTSYQAMEVPSRRAGGKGTEMVHFGEQQMRGERDKRASGEELDEIQVATTDVGLQRLESNSSDATGIGGHTLGTSNSLFNSVASSQRSLFRSATSSAGTRSWGGMKSRKKALKGTPEGRRLAALGFEEELSRTFDFWASWGIGMCNIGFMPGKSSTPAEVMGEMLTFYHYLLPANRDVLGIDDCDGDRGWIYVGGQLASRRSLYVYDSCRTWRNGKCLSGRWSDVYLDFPPESKLEKI